MKKKMCVSLVIVATAVGIAVMAARLVKGGGFSV